jgi:hypothetical protein
VLKKTSVLRGCLSMRDHNSFKKKYYGLAGYAALSKSYFQTDYNLGEMLAEQLTHP